MRTKQHIVIDQCVFIVLLFFIGCSWRCNDAEPERRGSKSRTGDVDGCRRRRRSEETVGHKDVNGGDGGSRKVYSKIRVEIEDQNRLLFFVFKFHCLSGQYYKKYTPVTILWRCVMILYIFKFVFRWLLLLLLYTKRYQ